MSRTQMSNALIAVLAIALFALPWVTALGDDTLPNYKCVTLASPKTCAGVGNSACSYDTDCSMKCAYCDISTALPDKICVSGFSGQECTTPTITKGSFCGVSDNYAGSCKKVDPKGTNCTCEGATKQKKGCSDKYGYFPCS